MHNKTEQIDNLYKTILKLETVEECYDFFDDICTQKEIEQMAERLSAAKLLLDGETYEQVIKKTNISSATLSRVSKCVKYGNGYKSIIKK